MYNVGMKKVIFLDMDGVLNCSTTKKVEGKVWEIDPKIVAKFNKVFDVCKDVEVVLSSSWRYAVKKGYIDINQLMKEVGYTGPDIVEMTPDGEDERGLEIQEWLDCHPEVEKFVILDDNDDMLHLLPKLIATGFYDFGLKDEHVERIIQALS